MFLMFGVVFGLMLLAFEDGIPFGLVKKIRCRFGWHQMRNKIGRLKVHRYYCKNCKKPRKHPSLKVIDGGRKISKDTFKF